MSTMNEADEILTAAEVAKIWKTTPSTILQWFHAGKIPAEMAEGRVIRFSKQAVAAALKSRAMKEVAR